MHRPTLPHIRRPADTARPEPAQPALPVVNSRPEKGLTAAQAEARTRAGLTNQAPRGTSKTEGQILRDNLFTFFNLVFVVLAACLFAVGSYLNAGFLGVVVCNAVIGIVQQLRAKHTIDQLTLLAAHKVRCVRDGIIRLLPSEELVRDDIVEFTAGEQICADAVVRTGTAQANEALITGEADAVEKGPGDVLRSGSFLISGRCRAQLTHVGADSYANRLAEEARAGHTVPKGEMMRSLDKLIRFIGIALVPLGILMFFNQFAALDMTLRDAVEATVASLVGMIPEGLYLLTSVALAVSMIRLARRKVLAQDMNCIETLARVDVLCVDKTGTITENRMEAGEPQLLDESWTMAGVETVLHSLYADAEPDNDTARALCRRFVGEGGEHWQRTATVPFSSAWKWSAATFREHGSFVVGAPDVVAGPRARELRLEMESYLERGCRLLLLAAYDGRPDPKTGLDPQKLRFLALLPLTNRVRAQAPRTFRYFEDQGVAIKVISGDNPLTVSRVARQAGVAGAENFVDATTLHTPEALAEAAERCTVFGRVTPDQKRQLVRAMQAAGHTVAMTGDGVNDVLALKDADCGIAMASGAQAASQVAQLVLLDSDFSGLPAVVAEGRRVINNIQRSAALYLVKNLFSFTFTLAALFITLPYPLQPIQLTLIAAVTIGIPSFVLALEPNHELVRGRFLPNVLRAALPGGLTDLVLVLTLEGVAVAFDMPYEMLSTLTTLVMLGVGLAVLWRVCRPFTLTHTALWVGMLVLAVAGVALFGRALDLVVPGRQECLVLLIFWAVIPYVLRLLTKTVEALHALWRRHRAA